jgi:hypothetical protein
MKNTRPLFNDQTKKILLFSLILLTGIFVNLAYSKPPKIVYIRDHPPRKGGYAVVKVETKENGDWSETTVTCKGYDDNNCCAYGVFKERGNDLSTEFNAAEINFIENSILPAIDERVLQGDLSGRTTFSMIVSGSNSAMTSFLVEWKGLTNGEVNVFINRLYN